MITILMLLMARQTRKSLESEIRLLRKEIKEKNTLISSLIPSKILESKYCEASNLQISNSRTSCLQEREIESTASDNALGNNAKEVFVEKTKITDDVQTTSLNHSPKQGDNNKVITTTVLVTELERWETASV